MEQRHRRRRGRRQARRKRRLRVLLITIILLILLACAAAAFAIWRHYGPTKDTADLDKYYGIENENQLAVIVDNEVLEASGMIADGKVYVTYEIVRDYINQRFYWDSNEKILLYTLPADLITVPADSKDYSVSKEKTSEDYVILKDQGETGYIALDFVKKYSNMDFEVYEEPTRVVINTITGDVKVAEAKKDTEVRYQGGVKSPVLSEVKKGTVLRLIEEEGDWMKVRTDDGFIGYVPKRALSTEKKDTITRDYSEPEFTSLTRDYKINMAWTNVTNYDANAVIMDYLPSANGLTTLSPTWFHVADTKGNIDSIAGADYVNYCHQQGVEVWAAVRDFDGGINSFEESYELLSSTESRDNLTSQLISAALSSGIDGINVDFEKISVECGEHYIQFIRELSVKCRQNGLVLSVDNYVPMSFNQQYHRDEQGVFADYVVIMGYDEHYGGSPEAGSVSSISYVKNGIEQTLTEVPAEKIISGVPFFTRVWKETPKTAEEVAADAGTDAAEYANKVESEAYSMEEARSVVESAGVTPIWDEETQQYYAEWESEGSTYKCWLEDADSLRAKLQLVKDYDLGGSAAWRLGQESSGIWDVISEYVK